MATFRKRSGSWRVEVYVDGVRRSATKPTKSEAAAWAVEQEAVLSGVKLPDKSVADALDRYATEVAPSHKGERWDTLRLTAIGRDWDQARRPVALLTAPDIADWRDARLKHVSPATVLREMNLLRSVLEVARRDWGWIKENPMRDVRRPRAPPARRRRIPETEVCAMLDALSYQRGERPRLVSQRIALAFLFALETAMRAGEILALRWRDVGQHSVTLPKTKNGDQRDVPLSIAARGILALLPTGDPEDSAFSINDGSRDTLWRKARKVAVERAESDNLARSLKTLHFHDARAEGIFRLSKKLDVLELAAMIGHRDPKSLMLYYSSSPEELANKLG